MSRAELGKFNAMSAKPDDKFSVPGCPDCHRLAGDAQHSSGEPTFWGDLGIDPLDVALRLWAVTGDLDQGLRAIERAWQAIDLHRQGESA